MTTELVKGFRDFSGKEAEKRAKIQKIIIETFEKYGFEPAETPIIEREEFVKGENKEDEAVSDIFKLQDKGKRKLALRYEFTFQLKRLMKNKKLPYKRYQIGPVFRDEPTTSNRLRQFVQCDIDIVGSDIKSEAEILSVADEILKNLNIKPIILINSRKLLNEILNDCNINEKNKFLVLREIDKIDKLSEKEIKDNLKKLDAESVLNKLKSGKKYFSKFNSYRDITELMRYSKLYGVNVLFSPSIVRGLSYYNGNIFEIKAKNFKETIIAGGSYNFGGIQCTGISFGLDRLSLLANINTNNEKYLIVSLNEDKEAIKLAKKLREMGKIVSIYYRKPSRALEYANSYGFNKVIFVGIKEVKNKKFIVKDMETGKESALKLISKY